jgi:hypothetical protein
LYLASVSYDEGLNLFAYDHFLVPLHDISPDVDSARERMLAIFKQCPVLNAYHHEAWGEKKSIAQYDNENSNYYTDGQVLFVQFK